MHVRHINIQQQTSQGSFSLRERKRWRRSHVDVKRCSANLSGNHLPSGKKEISARLVPHPEMTDFFKSICIQLVLKKRWCRLVIRRSYGGNLITVGFSSCFETCPNADVTNLPRMHRNSLQRVRFAKRLQA